MEILNLPPWTLNASLEQGRLEFTLGDGRRLAWRSQSSAECLDRATQPFAAALLLGNELASRLAASEPRPLSIQYAAELDVIDWEALRLGSACLAERFALARQLLSDAEPAPVAEVPLTESLAITLVHGAAVSSCLTARKIDWRDLGLVSAREAVAAAQVVVLDGVALPEFLDAAPLPVGRRLLVLAWPESPPRLAAVLDASAAALCLGRKRDGFGEPIETLLRHLGEGASVGEAVRTLRRRSPLGRGAIRLYGDPTMRFVRFRTPASRRQVTSLSFDIVGSTALLRRLGDEAYSEMLDSLHARCTDIVRRHGGQPDDPQGDDGVMCYFGHPRALEEAAVHAVEAGMKIVQTVADLAVSVRVGIATGFVAVSAGQPVGLSIHLAARLQKATAAGTVLASESTRSLVAHAFEFRRLESQPVLKGIDDAQDSHLVIAARGDVLAHRLDRVPLLTPFVGRRSELKLLDERWRRASADERGLVIVRAEAGMGKSRVVREFRRQLLQAGVKVLECRCRADASASPFLTLSEALRRWLDIDPHESADGAVRKLADAVPEKSREGEPLALLASLLGFVPQPRHSGPSRQRQRLLALLVEWFGAFAKEGPCCLIVEDWHWVDPSMRDFVQLLLDGPNEPRLLVVVTTRETTASAAAGQAGSVDARALTCASAREIQLGGLLPAEARELVSMVCAGMPLPAGLVRLLALRGDGVPLFLEEAARMALELGANRPGADIDALQTVPASLHDLLMARLDCLGDAKRVAQIAAVLGREFSLPLLSALFDTGAASLDAVSLGERLAVLINSGLVRAQGGDAYAFKHALVRDAAYASLWSRDRITLHAQVVRLLRERWPEQAAARPELLAMHQTEAGLDCDALVQWELAASNAAARSAEIEAISHLRRALAVLARIEPSVERDRTALRLQLLLAARLIATEGYGAEAVLHAYREAEALCDRIGDDTARFKVEMGLEAYRFMRADFAMALEHSRRAAAIAARSGDAKQRLHAQWGLACTLFHKGELRATMREMDVALGLYTPQMHHLFGVQDPGIMCMAYSSWALWELGRPDSALARVNAAVAIACEYEHKFSQAVALAYGVSIELLRGETEAALVRADACILVCEESGFPVWLAITRCMRGRLLCEQGRLDEGLIEMREGQGMWLSTGSMVSQPLYLALRAEGLLLAGDLEGAANCVDEGLDITDRYGELQLQAELRRLRGEIALRRGEFETAQEWLKRAYAQAMRQHRVGFALRSGTALARAWAARGERDRGRRLLQPLTARWTEGRTTRDVRAALALCETLA